MVTVVHRPEDARIYGRQILALVESGHDVDYAAPWEAFGASTPSEVTPINLPRAVGWNRFAAQKEAKRLMEESAGGYDVVIFHNPELIHLMSGFTNEATVVFDVHEDAASALVDKEWVPSFLRPIVAGGIGRAERLAESRFKLILAEEGYRERFVREHPVVPNEPIVPATVAESGSERVVHLGRHSRGRGLSELVEAARNLGSVPSLELYGWADDSIKATLREAESDGFLRWHGPVDNETGLQAIEGAAAGLSLLRDLPNYRHSRPTKVVEYMSRGIPVITTPLPRAVRIVEEYDCGIVVPFEDPAAVTDAVRLLVEDHELRQRLGSNGHAAARAHFNWERSGEEFVSLIERWATGDVS